MNTCFKSYLFCITLTIVGFSVQSCRKCNGTFCVKNVGPSAFVYSWDSNFLSDTLQPNEKTCITDIKIELTPTSEEYLIIPFNSSVGDYLFEVKECHQTVELL